MIDTFWKSVIHTVPDDCFGDLLLVDELIEAQVKAPEYEGISGKLDKLDNDLHKVKELHK
ncbi:hypothetical protein ACF0H5_001424 [Mactra antiquata]